jgi:hypothetical protein
MSRNYLLFYDHYSEEPLRDDQYITELEAMLREMIYNSGRKDLNDRARAILGDPPPPLRKLTGKIPRYQKELITQREARNKEGGS